LNRRDRPVVPPGDNRAIPGSQIRLPLSAAQLRPSCVDRPVVAILLCCSRTLDRGCSCCWQRHNGITRVPRWDPGGRYDCVITADVSTQPSSQQPSWSNDIVESSLLLHRWPVGVHQKTPSHDVSPRAQHPSLPHPSRTHPVLLAQEDTTKRAPVPAGPPTERQVCGSLSLVHTVATQTHHKRIVLPLHSSGKLARSLRFDSARIPPMADNLKADILQGGRRTLGDDSRPPPPYIQQAGPSSGPSSGPSLSSIAARAEARKRFASKEAGEGDTEERE
jgi:hypothetical protein